jgi:serine/threonine-protein kinase RsbW
MDDKTRPPKNSLTVTGQFKNLKKVLGFVQKAAYKAGFSEADNYKIQLAVDEAFTNIIEHAYEGKEVGKIECSYKITDQDLIIQLIDYGRAFDPESIESPDFNTDLVNRKTGGLGLYFIYQLMDEVKFKTISDADNLMKPGFPIQPCNVLVMTKRRS